MFIGVYFWGSFIREGFIWDYLEIFQFYELFFLIKGRFVGKLGCQVFFIFCILFRQGVFGFLFLIGYLIIVFFFNRVFFGDVVLNIYRVFLKVFKSLGLEEQIVKWDLFCKNIQIIVIYVQIELGYGIYFQGLEIEVIYDVVIQEFVIYSFILIVIKWWFGDLGWLVIYVLVQVQLVCLGVWWGMYVFIVLIWSFWDYILLLGIIVGDIGFKMDFD